MTRNSCPDVAAVSTGDDGTVEVGQQIGGETVGEVAQLHDRLKSRLQDSYYFCIMAYSTVDSFHKLFFQRRWPVPDCSCISPVSMPVDHKTGNHIDSSFHVNKCRHLSRWERVHSNVLRRLYSEVRKVTSNESPSGLVSYAKFIAYAYKTSESCDCLSINRTTTRV